MSAHTQSIQNARTVEHIMQKHFPHDGFCALPCATAGEVVMGFAFREGEARRMEYVEVNAAKFLAFVAKTKGVGVKSMLHKKYLRKKGIEA